MAVILVVDDSPMIQKVARALLVKRGHQVRVTGGVKSALIRAQAEAFDLIVMDLNLPDLGGDDAIRLIRTKMNIQAPIIVLSAEINTDVVLGLQPLGISAFVAKSDDFVERLGEEVDRALAVEF